MKRKDPKVEEPAAPYLAVKRPPAKPALATTPAISGDALFNQVAEKVFTKRKGLLRKLAQ